MEASAFPLKLVGDQEVVGSSVMHFNTMEQTSLITIPKDCDVLLDPASSVGHAGNAHFCRVIERCRLAYQAANDEQKAEVINSISNQLKTLGVRFLIQQPQPGRGQSKLYWNQQSHEDTLRIIQNALEIGDGRMPRKTDDEAKTRSQGHGKLNHPLIETPGDWDVLLSSGAAALCHPGNVEYSRLLASYQETYLTCPKDLKESCVRALLSELETRGVRFLKQQKQTHYGQEKGYWCEVDKQSIFVKIRNALEHNAHGLSKGLLAELARQRNVKLENGSIPPLPVNNTSCQMKSAVKTGHHSFCATPAAAKPAAKLQTPTAIQPASNMLVIHHSRSVSGASNALIPPSKRRHSGGIGPLQMKPLVFQPTLASARRLSGICPPLPQKRGSPRSDSVSPDGPSITTAASTVPQQTSTTETAAATRPQCAQDSKLDGMAKTDQPLQTSIKGEEDYLSPNDVFNETEWQRQLRYYDTEIAPQPSFPEPETNPISCFDQNSSKDNENNRVAQEKERTSSTDDSSKTMEAGRESLFEDLEAWSEEDGESSGDIMSEVDHDDLDLESNWSGSDMDDHPEKLEEHEKVAKEIERSVQNMSLQNADPVLASLALRNTCIEIKTSNQVASVLDKSIVHVILTCMHRHRTQEDVQSSASHLLSGLLEANATKFAAAIKSPACIQTVIDAMRVHARTRPVICDALTLLSKVSMHLAPNECISFCNHTLAEILIALRFFCSLDYEIVCHIGNIMWYLSEDAGCREALVAGGGGTSVSAVMPKLVRDDLRINFTKLLLRILRDYTGTVKCYNDTVVSGFSPFQTHM